MSRASLCTTGSANSSASAASSANAAGLRPPAEVMISGNSALAIRSRRFLDRAARRLGGRGSERPLGGAPRRDRRLRQHLARQVHVDRPARLAHRDVERAVDQRVDRLPGAQLVVPFAEFAHHAALVERLLAPVDRAVARADMAGLGERGAAGGEQQRDVVARRVHQAVDGVAGADRDVDHDGGRLAAGAVVAVRHRHRDVLVRHGDELRDLAVAAGVARDRLDDRREVGARIGEHVVDAAVGEAPDIGFRGDLLLVAQSSGPFLLGEAAQVIAERMAACQSTAAR